MIAASARRVPLTGRQRIVFEFIRDYLAANGFAPTFDEMSQHFGKTLGTLHEQVEQLERRGWITREGVANSRRNIAIAPDRYDEQMQRATLVRVAAETLVAQTNFGATRCYELAEEIADSIVRNGWSLP